VDQVDQSDRLDGSASGRIFQRGFPSFDGSRHFGGRTVQVRHLLPGHFPVHRSGGLFRTSGWLPHHLLDGTLHDHRPPNPEPFRVGFPAAGSRRLRLRRLQAVQQKLPNEPGCQCGGAVRTNGKPRVHLVQDVRRPLLEECYPLFVQRRKIKLAIKHPIIDKSYMLLKFRVCPRMVE